MFRWIPDWRNFKNEFCNSCQFRDTCAQPLSRTSPDPVPDLLQDGSRASTISSVHVDCTDPKRQSCRTAAWKRMSALSVSPPHQWHVEVEVVKPCWSGRIHVVLVLVKIKTVDLSLRIFHCVIVAKCSCFHVSKVFYSFLPIIRLLSMPESPTSSFEACCEQIAEIRNQPFQVSNCLGEAWTVLANLK